jgi:predicted transcriptional regulator
MNLPDNDSLAFLPVLTDEEKHQRTLAALADVDAGRTIPHEEMRAWAQSLFSRSKSAK